MGVFLMCVIQELCIASETSLDLYLQTCYENSAFMWFITIGFVYASQHYGPIVDLDQVPKAGFPLCSNPEKELPKHLGTLAKKGEVTYTGTFDDTPEEENMMIRLLCLKRRLCQWFPPMTTISNHAMFTEWLYSVPFPSPSKKKSWIQKKGKKSLIRHIKSLIPKDCFELDSDWRKEANESGINDLKKSYSFNMSIKENDYNKLHIEETTLQGHAKLLNLSMPFVDVEVLEDVQENPAQYQWFYAVLQTLYRENARFTGEELKFCLIAFWQRHQLLNPKLKITKMWNWNIRVAMSTTMTWKAVCAYWDGECNKLMNLNEQVNDFYLIYFAKCCFIKASVMKEFHFILVMFLQNIKPRYQEIICLIFVFNHLSNHWMKMQGFATLAEK